MEVRMGKKWIIRLLVAGILISLTACTGEAVEPTPTNAPVVENEDQDTPETEELTTDADTQENTSDDDSVGEAETPSIDAATIFSSNCARCHGADRSGVNGPPLLPGNLTKDASAYEKTITNGSGPMPAWGNKLSTEEINALAEWILTPVD
jgi:cytochrome c551